MLDEESRNITIRGIKYWVTPEPKDIGDHYILKWYKPWNDEFRLNFDNMSRVVIFESEEHALQFKKDMEVPLNIMPVHKTGVTHYDDYPISLGKLSD